MKPIACNATLRADTQRPSMSCVVKYPLVKYLNVWPSSKYAIHFLFVKAGYSIKSDFIAIFC